MCNLTHAIFLSYFLTRQHYMFQASVVMRVTPVYKSVTTRAVSKVRGLTLLLWVGTLWMCGDGSRFRSTSLSKQCTSYIAPSTSRKRAADRWSLQSSLSMVEKAQKSHGARSRLRGRCSNGVPLIHFFQAEHRIQFRSRSMRFLGFSNYEKGASRQEFSKWWTVCSTFWRSGWSVVRSASLSKGDTSKKRPSPHLFKVPTRSNKVTPRTLLRALVCHGFVNRSNSHYN
jgi:hypothetical protein